ncbi:MAG TPA: hypothetical protein VGR56_05395 [Nitrososphaerales archaeon]|nr:hypothetical protein [Nitrososphaerales archaeon]
MGASSKVALVAMFTALIVGSDFALAGIPNVKLLDTLVFLAAYLLGFRIGASVGILSELIWSYVSPWGTAGYIAPFLFLGEVIFALAGYSAARLWSGEPVFRSGKSLVFGGLLATCAFLWDLETNIGTALIASWPSVTTAKVGLFILAGVPFMLSHEVSDFLFGMFFVPIVILLVPRLVPGHRIGPRPFLGRNED